MAKAQARLILHSGIGMAASPIRNRLQGPSLKTADVRTMQWRKKQVELNTQCTNTFVHRHLPISLLRLFVVHRRKRLFKVLDYLNFLIDSPKIFFLILNSELRETKWATRLKKLYLLKFSLMKMVWEWFRNHSWKL